MERNAVRTMTFMEVNQSRLFEVPLQDAVAYLMELLVEIPEASRDSARLYLDTREGELDVTYAGKELD